MQTDTTSYTQPGYELTAYNSHNDWIVAHNSQITRVAARNSKIAGLTFHRQVTCWLDFRISYLLKSHPDIVLVLLYLILTDNQ